MAFFNRTTFASILLIGTPIAAVCSTIDVSLGSGQGLNVYLNANGADELGYLGMIQVVIDGGPVQHSFCIDLFHDIGASTYNVALAVADLGRQGQVSWLLDNVQPLLSTPEQLAGLQLAIWDLIEDGGDGFSAGLVRQGASNATNPVVLAFAQDYVNFVFVNGFQISVNHSVLNITSIPAGIRQQTLMLVEAPEPATLGMVLGGGLLLALVDYRRRSKSQTHPMPTA